MTVTVCCVIPLIGVQTAILLRLRELSRESFCDMNVVVRIAVGDRRNLAQLGPAQAQHVLLLAALGLGNHDYGAVAARIPHKRKADPGVAGGAFDDHPPRSQEAAFLRIEDNIECCAVLYRTPGIQELSLSEDAATGP